MSARLATLVALLGLAAGCERPSAVDTAESPRGTESEALIRSGSARDSLDNPTDTNITLLPNLWVDKEFNAAEGRGFNLYHFTPSESGLVAFQMFAPVEKVDELWAYLRIEDSRRPGTYARHQWGSAGNRASNFCEVVVEVEKGVPYRVVAYSEQSSHGARIPVSTGKYSVAAIPLGTSF